MFEQEKATLARELPRLLTEFRGQWALVKGERVRVWETEADAAQAGRAIYPGEAFYVRQITDTEEPLLNVCRVAFDGIV